MFVIFSAKLQILFLFYKYQANIIQFSSINGQ